MIVLLRLPRFASYENNSFGIATGEVGAFQGNSGSSRSDCFVSSKLAGLVLDLMSHAAFLRCSTCLPQMTM